MPARTPRANMREAKLRAQQAQQERVPVEIAAADHLGHTVGQYLKEGLVEAAEIKADAINPLWRRHRRQVKEMEEAEEQARIEREEIDEQLRQQAESAQRAALPPREPPRWRQWATDAAGVAWNGLKQRWGRQKSSQGSPQESYIPPIAQLPPGEIDTLNRMFHGKGIVAKRDKEVIILFIAKMTEGERRNTELMGKTVLATRNEGVYVVRSFEYMAEVIAYCRTIGR